MNDMLIQGGPVLWFILFIGLVALSVFLERALHLHRARIDAKDFLHGIFNTIRRGNVTEAITLCEETPGPVAAVTLTAIRHRQGSLEAMREAVDNKGRAELSRMERRLASLAVTCQTAPLLGLLGTLLGVVKIVQGMNEQAPIIQSTDLTAGLMHALLAAAAGLMVAVPCHVMYALLMVRIERIVLDMEASASEIVAFLTKQNTSML